VHGVLWCIGVTLILLFISHWNQSGLPSLQFNHWKEDPKKKWKTKFQMGFHHLMEEILNTGVI
jgi:hypothetical protein